MFVYAPEGQLTAAQRFTIAQMRNMAGRLALICATERMENMPVAALDDADALYWKALPGYDFSAYALALADIASLSPGADVYVQNDSVLGPFGAIDALIERSPWDFTGFLANAALENHIQSYAFHVRNVGPARLAALRSVLSTRWACERWRDVVNLQETRLARVAARSMQVGSLWFAPSVDRGEFGMVDALRRKLFRGATAAVHDPGLVHATILLDQGFPFLKKSLFGKNRGFQDIATLDAYLAGRGHPPILVDDHG